MQALQIINTSNVLPARVGRIYLKLRKCLGQNGDEAESLFSRSFRLSGLTREDFSCTV